MSTPLSILAPGVKYTVGKTTHTFPQISVKGEYRYISTQSLLHGQLLTMLYDFDKLCTKRNIEYVISWGTLLGALRHQGFIPWDDDADLEILDTVVPQLLTALTNHPVYILKKMHFGYKILRKGSTFPFIDIFVTTFSSKEKKLIYAHPLTRTAHPRYRHDFTDVYPRRRYVFENIVLWGPAFGELICQRLYTPDCLQSAIVVVSKHNPDTLLKRFLQLFTRKE